MWLMLQQEGPDDFVLATGHMHSVREFVVAAFKYIGREIEWEGAGDNEVAKEKSSGIIRYQVSTDRPSRNNSFTSLIAELSPSCCSSLALSLIIIAVQVFFCSYYHNDEHLLIFLSKNL
jgi:hypothetical protein